MKKKKEDTGLRGTVEGKLYVDLKVFFKRPEVIKMLKFMSTSETYPKLKIKK
jgi:hypothetical protein